MAVVRRMFISNHIASGAFFWLHRRNRSTASNSAYTFLRRVVCRSRAPCLNRSTDLYAICHLAGIHGVIWVSLIPKGRGDLEAETLPSQNSQLQIAAATWRIETRSDSVFSKITLDLFLLTC